MEKHRISIIVPVYNAEQYLDQCIQSLTGQTYENKEIILVDDGSKDAGGRMCDAYAAQHSGIVRVIHKENGGLVSAWTCGMEAASGQYLSFVDSDDWVDTCMLAEMAAHLTGSDAEIVSCDYVIEDGASQRYMYQALTPGVYDRERLLREVFPNLLGNEKRLVHASRCMKLISTPLMKKAARYADKRIVMGEDLSVTFPLLLEAQRLVVPDHKAYYHYRYVAESMIHNYNRGMAENIEMLYSVLAREATEAEAAWPAAERAVFESAGIDLMTQVDREYIHLLLLAVKKEARGNPKGYAANIRHIATEQPAADRIRRVPVEVSERSNRLLYRTLKDPSMLNLRLLRLAMIVFYGIRRR